jgi:orotate phosphoribosyltransferase
MNTETILAEFEAADAILKGHFILSSGLHSDTYLQCARVMMDAARGERLCAALADKVRTHLPIFPDVIVAPAMGGVVVGYEMGRQLALPTMFCERVDGAFTLRRGFHLEAGQTVLMIEDVVTTGKSSLEAVACVESYGATVVAEASLIDRSGGNHALPFPLFSLLTLEVASYAPDTLPSHLQNIPAVKPGSRWLKA